MSNYIGEAFRSILTPGITTGFVWTLNGALLSLIAVVSITLFAKLDSSNSIHLYIFLFLALGLMASVNWFIIEVRKAKQMQQSEIQEQQVSDKKTD